jgi:hypothetical protein
MHDSKEFWLEVTNCFPDPRGGAGGGGGGGRISTVDLPLLTMHVD